MKTRYFLQLVALSALWGAGYLLTRIATPALGPSVMAASRLGFGAATLALIMLFNHASWPWKHWRELLLIGAIGIAMPHFLYSWSSLFLPAGYSAVLSVTSVLFGTFASAWMKEDTLTLTKLIGCVAAFIGVALVVRPGPLQSTTQLLQGTALAICGAAMSGSTAPLLKRATTRMEPLAITAVIHLYAFLLLAPVALWNLPKAHFTAGAVAAVAVMGIATSGLAYWLYMRIVKHVTPVAALSSTFMVTIFGVLWGHLVLGEVFTLASYAGAALVLVATVMVTGFNPLRRSEEAVLPKS